MVCPVMWSRGIERGLEKRRGDLGKRGKRWDFMARKVPLYAAICGRRFVWLLGRPDGFVCSVIRVRALPSSPSSLSLLSHNGKTLPLNTLSCGWTCEWVEIFLGLLLSFTFTLFLLCDYQIVLPPRSLSCGLPPLSSLLLHGRPAMVPF